LSSGLVDIDTFFKVPLSLLTVVKGCFELVFGHLGHIIDVVGAEEVLV
jgi:hypothetical protein